ncbi:hypothetical protein MmiHf6_13380 [Methanimicrococcus hongohii]|uniref:Uncharacterized protein n=1 Tax=Methanimicrococcus hongohii TaxID=3028295 RepID=A0AA96V1A9_9EURY|nr:hypothetical protein [Methanimicrococcus sp. Hf6]WNY24013.1 hypothetical protein MmiHf6_13380 [Methanimicrococcus sp. Hf6]
MIENSKGMKIAVLIFSVILVAVAVLGTVDSAEHNRSFIPVNGNLGGLYVSWDMPTEFEDLVIDSDLILIGTVSDKSCIWNTDDGEKPSRYEFETDFSTTFGMWISTSYEIDNLEVLKGEADSVQARAPGGTVDGYTLTVSPMQDLEVGDTVLLFLSSHNDLNGNPMPWYHLSWPLIFTEMDENHFENEYYGEISVDDLRIRISESGAA